MREKIVLDDGERLTAAVLAVGLRLGAIDRRAVVAWADQLIVNMPSPDLWIIDLSLSAQSHVLDLIAELETAANGVDGEQVYRATLAILEVPQSLTFDEAERFASKLYQVARACLGGDWSSQIVRDALWLEDEFALVRDGIVSTSRDEVIDNVRGFVESNRLVDPPQSLRRLRVIP